MGPPDASWASDSRRGDLLGGHASCAEGAPAPPGHPELVGVSEQFTCSSSAPRAGGRGLRWALASRRLLGLIVGRFLTGLDWKTQHSQEETDPSLQELGRCAGHAQLSTRALGPSLRGFKAS